jgi:threonine dehydratase
MRYTHHLVEPSGAAALAGLIVDQAALPGRRAKPRLGAILSGGNIDASVLAEILAGRTPAP